MPEPLNVYFTRVRAHQTDLNGVMYHGAYFDIFDDARIETFRRLGYPYSRLDGSWIPVIRRVDCEYFQPALMDDLLSVTVLIKALRPATMQIRYECRRDLERLAVGHATFAFVTPQLKPMRVPQDLRETVESNAAVLGFSGSR